MGIIVVFFGILSLKDDHTDLQRYLSLGVILWGLLLFKLGQLTDALEKRK